MCAFIRILLQSFWNFFQSLKIGCQNVSRTTVSRTTVRLYFHLLRSIFSILFYLKRKFRFRFSLRPGTKLSKCHKMNFMLFTWGYTDYFEVTVVRDTHRMEIFEANVYVQISVKFRRLSELFTHNFIPLFIVHQNPSFVWWKILCSAHQRNLKTTRRTVVRDMWYGTVCPMTQNEVFHIKN